MATRQHLIEQDMDALEELVRTFAQGQRGIERRLTGMLIAIATGSLMLLINMVVMGLAR